MSRQEKAAKIICGIICGMIGAAVNWWIFILAGVR